MAKILIKNGKVWDGEKFFFADLLTEDDKIAKIESDIEDEADFTFDAEGKIVSAGLVDIHTHMLGYYGVNPELSNMPFGVTSAVDVSAKSGDKEKYENYLVKNKVLICAEFENKKAVFDNTEKLLHYYGERAIGLKVYFDITMKTEKDINSLKEVCEYAREHNLIVMVHSSNSPSTMAEIISVLGKGDILTHAFHGGVNNASEDDFECLKKAKEKGIIIDAGFAGNVHTDFKVFSDAVKNGAIPDTISTDITKFSAYKRGGRYGMTMCMSIAKTLGMSEKDIFRAVTSAPAKTIGKENEWGYLKVGRCADIAVFDYTDEGFELTDKAGNTVKNNKGYRCVLTICDGQVVYKN